MRYGEIVETDAVAQSNAQRVQRDKLAASNEKIAKASQRYQSSVKAAHDSAAAARKKLNAPPKPTVKPISPILPGKILTTAQTGCL